VRNGDRWRITARTLAGGLAVEHLDGRGQTLLPPDYVAEHVRLAYALTVHKTQGLTVDHCVLVVDERTAAEHAYVGLTRGRLDNRACVVCEPTGWGGPAPEARNVLAAALVRSIGEVSATETLRDALVNAESLAVLYPAWLEARHHLDTHAGPDRHAELEALGEQVEVLRRRLRYLPVARRNVESARAELTRASRSLEVAKAEVALRHQPRSWWRRPEPVQHIRTAEDVAVRQHWVESARAELTHTEDVLRRVEADEPTLAELDEKAATLAGTIAQRQAWLEAHPTERAWEADLRQRITSRTRELGETAAHDWPEHVIGLIGPVPNRDRTTERDGWATLAGRIESYRERWGIDPDYVGVEPDGRGEQHRHWQRLMLAIDDAQRRPESPQVLAGSAYPTRQAPIAANRRPDIGL